MPVIAPGWLGMAMCGKWPLCTTIPPAQLFGVHAAQTIEALCRTRVHASSKVASLHSRDTAAQPACAARCEARHAAVICRMGERTHDVCIVLRLQLVTVEIAAVAAECWPACATKVRFSAARDELLKRACAAPNER